MVPVDLDAKVAFLKNPAHYPEFPAQVEAVETHMSWVFLTDRYAYKLKKPVRYDFLDFSTPDARCRDCKEEVRLNRRLAEGVYLGVAPLTLDAKGHMQLDGIGSPIDCLVKMHRLPEERMLDQAIRKGRVEEAEVRRFAQVLADFYRRALPVNIGGEEYRQRFKREIKAHYHELSDPDYGLPTAQVNAIFERQLGLLEREPQLFDQRVEQRRIVEAHGDLRPQHICLTPKPVIIDCLEFNLEFRILDPVDELAFLAMECERAGAAYIDAIVFDVYRKTTGDDPPAKLLHFYQCYRAFLRAKLSIWHLKDHDHQEHSKWVKRTEQYLALAQKYSVLS